MREFSFEHDRVVTNPLCRRNGMVVVGLIFLVFSALLGVIIWQATDSDGEDCANKAMTSAQLLSQCPTTSGKPVTTGFPITTVHHLSSSVSSQMTSLPAQESLLPATVGHINVDENMVLNIAYESGSKLTINLLPDGSAEKNAVVKCKSGTNLPTTQGDTVHEQCLDVGGHSRLLIKRLTTNGSTITNNISGTQSTIDCYDIEWTALNCPKQVLQNCINVSTAHWYGGYADKHQYWPFDKNTRTMSAYLVNDSYMGEIGGVIDRYFISSSGFGVYIDDNVPLYFNLNDPDDGMMCLTAKFDNYPYFNLNNVLPSLKYTVCHGFNIKEVHTAMLDMFIDKPRDIPDEDLFRYPIWSTWAQFHKDINQTYVLSFADAILKNNFTHAQLEIDDDWTPAYGDMTFNEEKFPNATEMVQELNTMGFRVTVWVHPFFNVDSKSFMELATKGFLIRQMDSPMLALTPWWDGQLAGILDVSNPNAVDWFLEKLENLTVLYNISSFKFDAGETSWLPHVYSAANIPTNPSNMYPGQWIDLAFKADNLTRHQEVRAMYRTQKYPVFVRMMDKGSDWSHANGLKSIIPGVLTYGILGYPFVLPDMIGGNAYNNQPDPELFIRWIQLNAFLPGIQFSIVPWAYNETVIDIARIYTDLHEQISVTLIKFARNAVRTGEPIIRPLWWMAPADEVALICEDEFLLGDEYLVAPIVEQGARSRDIYFPPGDWLDELKGGNFTGPGWWYNYSAAIDELPYFKASLLLSK